MCTSAIQRAERNFTKDCQGLSNCKGEIIKVTLTEAKEKGKTICGYED
jgi:hypothetical protein